MYSKPLEDSFQVMGRDFVDKKMMRGLVQTKLFLIFLRNPRRVEMVIAINNGPKGYKPAS